MKNTKKSKPQITSTTKELAEILGFSDRRIRQLESEGALVKISRNNFNLPASIQKYIKTIQEENEPDEIMDYNKERALLTRANRKMAEMELKILQGDVHRSEDVENVMNDMLTSFRAQILVIPGKAAPQLIGLTDLEDIKKVIKDIIYEALQELSEYDPNMFYNKDVVKTEDKSEDKSEEKNIKKKNSSGENGQERDKS